MKQKSIAVIGGGFTGMTAAYRLAKAGGWRVTLVERGNALGGLAGDFTMQGTQIEKTYHHLFRTDKDILELVDELGLSGELMWRDSSVGIYYGGKSYPFMSPMDVLNFKPISFLNRLRLGLVAFYLQKRKYQRGFAEQTACQWLRRAFGRQVTEVVWEPLLRGKFDRYAESVSMAWMWYRIHSRGNSREKTAVEKLGYFRGGFAIVTNKIESELVSLGATILKNTRVEELKSSENGVHLVMNGKRETFDRCIFTGPSSAFSHLLAGSHPELASYRQQLESIQYLGAICMVFATEQEMGDYYWLNINQASAPFLVFIRHTKLVDKGLYNGKEIYYIGSYQMHDSALFSMSDDEIAGRWLGYLKQIFPKFDATRIVEKHLFKLKNAQHVVDCGYQAKIPNHKTPLSGVYLANFSQVYPEDRGTNFAVREGNKITDLVQQDTQP